MFTNGREHRKGISRRSTAVVVVDNNSRAVVDDNSRAVVDNSRAIEDNSRAIVDNGRAVVDNSRYEQVDWETYTQTVVRAQEERRRTCPWHRIIEDVQREALGSSTVTSDDAEDDDYSETNDSTDDGVDDIDALDDGESPETRGVRHGVLGEEDEMLSWLVA